MRLRAGAGFLVLVLGAVSISCGEEPALPQSGSTGSPSGSTEAPSEDQLYEGTGMVLEDEDGPILCLSGVNDSLPPQCGGPKLRGWSWEGLEFDEAGGTKWGTFTVQGTYVDGVFTLKGEPEVPEPFEGGGDPITVPCEEPPTGWAMPEPERTTDEDRLAATRAAEREPDSAGVWIDYIVEPTNEQEMQPWGENIVLVLAFTGDPERHEAEAREHWGGALCIWVNDRTEAELMSIQKDLGSEWVQDMGIETTWSSIDIPVGIVEIGVIVSTPQFEAELEERYGANAVLVMPALKPID